MDFSLSDEQALLQDSVERFIQNEYDFDSRQALVNSPDGFSRENWKLFAELGWTAVPFAEEDGGLGGSPIDLMILTEQFGRGLVVEPYLPTVVLAGGLISRGATPVQKERYLPGIIGGEIQAAFAFAEPQSRFGLADLTTRASRDGDGYVLNGKKAVVLNAPSADILVVSARTSGEQRDIHGISLFILSADSAGIERRGYPTVDGHRAAEITLENVRAENNSILGAEGGALPLIEAITDTATLAVSSEAVGIMEMLQKKTLDYTKSRVQFGVPIGSFQALQHRMVDMFMDYEQTKSLLYMAAMRLQSGGPHGSRAVSALKYQIGTAGRKLGQEAVQLHGGMGVTEELDVSHYFKRLTTIETLFGNADYHLGRFSTIS